MVFRLFCLVLLGLSSGAVYGEEAFGAPGVPPLHGPSQKSFVGSAVEGASSLSFTGYRGILSEVYFPAPDRLASIDLQWLVADRAGRFIDEEKQQSYRVTRPDPRSLRWQVSTWSTAHGWRIDKSVFAVPDQHAVIQRNTIISTDGRPLREFSPYLLYKPFLGDNPADNSARTVMSPAGRTVLLASGQGASSVLAISQPWAKRDGVPLLSNGFVGRSDGWTLLFGGQRRLGLFDSASHGNVAQTGLLDTSTLNADRIHVDVVLAFGRTDREALAAADSVLASSLSESQARHDAGWQNYLAGLSLPGGMVDERYLLAAMTLKTLQDKTSGAMVAGLGTPWGATQGMGNRGGYHLVWPRDLFKYAGALLSAGDSRSAARVVRYLFGTLQQQELCGDSEYLAAECAKGFSRPGRFPQNAWIDGTPYWNGTQLDEQAMPLILAWRAGASVWQPLWPRIRQTADYVLATGPRTGQERWEENGGYSPASMAAGIAGLVCAADMALLSGDSERAGRYLAAADLWQANVEAWTATRTGRYGAGQYYLRLNPSAAGDDGVTPRLGPDQPQWLDIRNGGGTRDARSVVDGGFLELVRYGVKAADDPLIVASLAVVDSVIGQRIGNESRVTGWFRYPFDGYGEKNDGRDFDGEGVGRVWPILTAERGIAEIARSGNGRDGEPYRRALAAMATAEGFIPEQVWSSTVQLTDGWRVVTPAGSVAGTPTASIAPLGWAMGEYMTLLASMTAGRVVDMPAVVCLRYGHCPVAPEPGDRAVTLTFVAETRPGERLYLAGNHARLGRWNPALGVPLQARGKGRWQARLWLPAGKTFDYRVYRKPLRGAMVQEVGAVRRVQSGVPVSVAREEKVVW